MSRHLAIGPDGGNLLGFLASVGALLTLTDAWPDRDVRLSWSFVAVAWRPVFHVRGQSSDDEVIDALHGQLVGRESSPELTRLGVDLTVGPEEFRRFACEATEAATANDRRWVDFVAAFGCEATPAGSTIQDTALRTMSGAGHQHFIGSMRELARLTSAADICRALCHPWQYVDDRPSMRWDPIDDRRYALRADNPAKSTTGPIRTVRGANRLAVEALRCFPTMPSGRQLATTGFLSGSSANRRRWVIRWPIWKPPCSALTIASLLAHPEILQRQPSTQVLTQVGVEEIFESSRQTVGQLRSFVPAQALLGPRTPSK